MLEDYIEIVIDGKVHELSIEDASALLRKLAKTLLKINKP